MPSLKYRDPADGVFKEIGGAADVSIDAENIASLGSDSLIYVPDQVVVGPTAPTNTDPLTSPLWVDETTSTAPSSLYIDDMLDVDTATTAPVDGDTLVWNATSSQWVPALAAARRSRSPTLSQADLEVELWVNTATTATAGARSGWSVFDAHFDSRYAPRQTATAVDVDLIATSGYWIIDPTTTGTLPPGEPNQILHTLVMSPEIQIQYAYDPYTDGVNGIATVHNRNQMGGVWSPWQNVTPTVIGA